MLRLSTLTREEDETSFVLLEALHVTVQRFGAFIGSSMVNADTDASSKVLVDTSFFQLLKSESSSISKFSIILLRRTTNNRSKRTSGRTREDLSGFGLSLIRSRLLLRRLVEPSADSPLPLLVEVLVGYHVVVAHHLEDRVSSLPRPRARCKPRSER